MGASLTNCARKNGKNESAGPRTRKWGEEGKNWFLKGLLGGAKVKLKSSKSLCRGKKENNPARKQNLRKWNLSQLRYFQNNLLIKLCINDTCAQNEARFRTGSPAENLIEIRIWEHEKGSSVLWLRWGGRKWFLYLKFRHNNKNGGEIQIYLMGDQRLEGGGPDRTRHDSLKKHRLIIESHGEMEERLYKRRASRGWGNQMRGQSQSGDSASITTRLWGGHFGWGAGKGVNGSGKEVTKGDSVGNGKYR